MHTSVLWISCGYVYALGLAHTFSSISMQPQVVQYIVAQLLLTRHWDVDPVITYTDSVCDTLTTGSACYSMVLLYGVGTEHTTSSTAHVVLLCIDGIEIPFPTSLSYSITPLHSRGMALSLRRPTLPAAYPLRR